MICYLGNESPCLVEYAPYQKGSNSSKKVKKDAKIDTIDEDQEFLAFKEEFEKEDHALETPETFLFPGMQQLIYKIHRVAQIMEFSLNCEKQLLQDPQYKKKINTQRIRVKFNI